MDEAKQNAAFGDVTRRVGRLQRELAKMHTALSDLERKSRDLDKNAFLVRGEAAALTQKATRLMEEVSSIAELPTALAALSGQAEEASRRLKDRLGLAVASAVEALGLPVSGRFPELSVGPFVITFRAEVAQAELALGKGGPVLDKVAMDADKVGEALRKHYAELFDGEFAREHFLNLVRQALQRANRIAERSPEAPVPVSEFLLELNVVHQKDAFASNPTRAGFQPYTRLMASTHLFRARPLSGEGFEIRLVVATREQTRKKGDHIYVPTDLRGHGTHFGALALKNLGAP
ncbi:MAG: hypothetical protein CMH54_10765 [Myxococcales bacterium]|mgnify:CR=1 FL=1|nr:hypothetical protein [Myxococcales bacterium]